MERIAEKALLFDFYGELLTTHQKAVYEEAVNNDMSLSEIAEEFGITRQGVHDLVKRCDKILKDYESKLHLVERFILMRSKAEEIQKEAKNCTEGISDAYKSEQIVQGLSRIAALSAEIIEEL